jgi:predicted membrane protein
MWRFLLLLFILIFSINAEFKNNFEQLSQLRINWFKTERHMPGCKKFESYTASSSLCEKAPICMLKNNEDNKLCLVEGDCKDGFLTDERCVCNQRYEQCGCLQNAIDCVPQNRVLDKQDYGNSSCFARLKAAESKFICSFVPSSECDDITIPLEVNELNFPGPRTLYTQDNNFILGTQKQGKGLWKCNILKQYKSLANQSLGGSKTFCESHTCISNPQKVCTLGGKNYRLIYRDERCKIDVISWRKTVINIYPYKQPPRVGELGENKEPLKCPACAIKCSAGGIQIDTGGVNFHMYSVKSGGVIVESLVMKKLFDVSLPRDIISRDYVVTIVLTKRDTRAIEFDISCPQHPFCEMINCYICWERVLNYQCIPLAIIIVMFFALYFFIIFSINGCDFCVRAAKILYYFGKILYYILRLLFFGIYFFYRKLMYNESFSRNLFGNSKANSFMVKMRGSSDKMNTYRKRQKFRLAYNPVTDPAFYYQVAIIFSLVHTGNLCEHFESMSASKRSCFEEAGGKKSCTISDTIELALPITGQDSCLTVTNAADDQLGNLRVTVDKVQLICKPQTLFYSRSFKTNVASKHVCGATGECAEDNGCLNVERDTCTKSVGECDKVGMSGCYFSCSCYLCDDCMDCDPSCIFYRKYIEPTADKRIYHFFQCPEYVFRIVGRVRLDGDGAPKDYQFDLLPGIPQNIGKNDRITITLKSATIPPVPLLGYKFVDDGSRAAFVDTLDMMNNVRGQLGMFRCGTQDKAQDFKGCSYPDNLWDCDDVGYKYKCNVLSEDMQDTFQKSNTLPITLEGMLVNWVDGKIVSTVGRQSGMMLQVTFRGYKLSGYSTKSKCQVKFHSMGGCYSCSTGSVIDQTCSTDFGEALAEIRCGSEIRSTVHCNEDGIRSMIHVRVTKPQIDEKCNVKCPGGKSTFDITGSLHFQEVRTVSKLHTVGLVANTSDGKSHFGKINWGAWLSFSNPFFSIIFTLLMIGGAVLFVIYVLPLIVQCCLSRKKREKDED